MWALMTCLSPIRLSINDRSRAGFPRAIRPYSAVTVDPSARSARVAVLRFRKYHEGFELVPAGLALPQMAHTLRTEILRPFRHEDRLAALRAEVAQPRFDGFPDARSQFHSAFPSVAIVVASSLTPDEQSVSRMLVE